MKLRTIWLTPDINFHGTFLGGCLASVASGGRWHGRLLWRRYAWHMFCLYFQFDRYDHSSLDVFDSLLMWECSWVGWNVLECSVELSLVNFSVLSLERVAFELLFLCILLTPCARLPPLPPKMPTSAKFMIIPRSDPTNSTPKQMPTFACAYLAHI